MVFELIAINWWIIGSVILAGLSIFYVFFIQAKSMKSIQETVPAAASPEPAATVAPAPPEPPVAAAPTGPKPMPL